MRKFSALAAALAIAIMGGALITQADAQPYGWGMTGGGYGPGMMYGYGGRYGHGPGMMYGYDGRYGYGPGMMYGWSGDGYYNHRGYRGDWSR